MKITSTQNPKIKNIIKLKKSRERKKQDLLVIEGRHEISLAEKAGVEIKEIYLCDQFSSDNNFKVNLTKPQKFELEKAVFEKVSSRQNPDGYLALARIKEKKLDTVKLKNNSLVLVLDKLEKPGNLGAIMRTADGAGVDLVLVTDKRTDILNHNVIRSSLGTVFTNQIVACSSQEAQAWLSKNSISLIASTPRASKSCFELNFSGSVAIIIGPEHEGLSDEWLNLVDEKIKIPMQGKADSLNASVAAAVLIYTAQQKRNQF